MNPQRLLIIGYVWPEPNSSAAGSRMMQLIFLFQKMEYEIKFASPAADSEFAFKLNDIGVEKVNILLNDNSFDQFITKLNPDVVLFDRFMMEEQFGWRVAENCPHAMRILDTEDLHSLRKARETAFKEMRTLVKQDLFNDTAKREIASILRCDCSLIISEFEMQLLQDMFKVDLNLLFYLPILFEPIDTSHQHNWPAFENRKHFIFIGNFLHEPNVNAVQYLKKEIWPLIRKALPTAELHIYGAYPSKKIFSLHKPEQGFYVYGRTENSNEVLQSARVSLAPMRFGAGIKGKLLESMSCGTPCITSSIGAEGIAGTLNWPGMIADDPNEFARTAVQLYADENLWKAKQQNGINIINSRFSKSLFEAGLIEHINTLKNNLTSFRLQNFTGAMLMQQTTLASKYMSKWIEAKNKKVINKTTK